MTVADVCSIISTSAREGVTVLKFRDLRVEFGFKPLASSPYPLSTPAAIPTAEMVAPLQKKEEEHSTELDELELRERQIEELLLTDPLAAEEMIRLGELEDDDGSNNDDG